MDRGFDTEETLTRVYEEFFPKIYNYVYYQKMCIRDRNKRVSIHIKKRRLRTNLQPCNAGDFRDDREKARLPACLLYTSRCV